MVIECFRFDDLYATGARSAATEPFDPVLWKATQEEMAVAVTARLSRHRQDAPDSVLLLLIDDNFHYRSMRKRFWQVANEGGSSATRMHMNLHTQGVHRPDSSLAGDDPCSQQRRVASVSSMWRRLWRPVGGEMQRAMARHAYQRLRLREWRECLKYLTPHLLMIATLLL